MTLEVQPELHPLLAQAPGIGPRHPLRHNAAPIPATAAIEIMELQHALRHPPGNGHFLSIPALTTGGVGVCWQAGGWDPARSIPLDQLRPVLPPGAVSLQRGATGLPDPLAGSMDIALTARLIAGLDCVVTVDTMIAHLAGALGRPVHLLLKADADWRWGREHRTAWYPQTRIHRQHRAGDWTAALDSPAAALRPGRLTASTRAKSSPITTTDRPAGPISIRCSKSSGMPSTWASTALITSE